MLVVLFTLKPWEIKTNNGNNNNNGNTNAKNTSGKSTKTTGAQTVITTQTVQL